MMSLHGLMKFASRRIHQSACIISESAIQAYGLSSRIALELGGVGNHPHVLQKNSCPSSVCLISLLHALLPDPFSSKAYVCTAPTACLCAVAEGLSSFYVPKLKSPFITNHPPFDVLWSEGAWRKGNIYHFVPNHTQDFTAL